MLNLIGVTTHSTHFSVPRA